MAAYEAIVSRLAKTYRLNCYREGEFSTDSCKSIFIKPRLPFTIRDSACPFAESMCHGRDHSAVSIDTGLLDLSDDFGLNVPKTEAIKYRKKITCTVLPLEGRIENITSDATKAQKDDSRLRYMGAMPVSVLLIYFGPYPDPNPEYGNATFVTYMMPNSGVEPER